MMTRPLMLAAAACSLLAGALAIRAGETAASVLALLGGVFAIAAAVRFTVKTRGR